MYAAGQAGVHHLYTWSIGGVWGVYQMGVVSQFEKKELGKMQAHGSDR